jgi:hypothetical protein
VRALAVPENAPPLLEITAVVINERLTPTHAAVDLKNKITPPDLVTLAGPNLRVITSQWSQDPFFTKPTTTKHDPHEVRLPNIPGMGTRYIRWIASGAAPATVKVKSIKGGVAEKTAE